MVDEVGSADDHLVVMKTTAAQATLNLQKPAWYNDSLSNCGEYSLDY